MAENTSFIHNFVSLLSARRDSQKNLREKSDEWKFDEEHLEEFDEFFAEILQGKSILDIVHLIRKKNGSVSALHVFGGETILRELGVDEGEAVRLKNKNGQNEAVIRSPIRTIAGDVYSKKTWDQVTNNKDLVLSMGRAALHFLPEDSPDAMYFLLNSVWGKMSKNGSIALLQIPRYAESEFAPWFQKILKIEGIDGGWVLKKGNDGASYFSVLIAKSPQAPSKLPTL